MSNLEQRANSSGSITQTQLLKLAGVHQWTWLSIRDHKDREFAKAPPPSWWYGKQSDIEVALFAAVVILIIASGVTLSNDNILAAVGCFFAALSCALIGKKVVPKIHVRGPALWKTYYLDHYVATYGPLPQTAQDMLTALQTNGRDISLCVCVLEQNKVLIDPVLYVFNDVPICVWDMDGNIILPPKE